LIFNIDRYSRIKEQHNTNQTTIHESLDWVKFILLTVGFMTSQKLFAQLNDQIL